MRQRIDNGNTEHAILESGKFRINTTTQQFLRSQQPKQKISHLLIFFWKMKELGEKLRIQVDFQERPTLRLLFSSKDQQFFQFRLAR